jgi:pimeloyl-ACP methyl ester carboxylesterase
MSAASRIRVRRSRFVAAMMLGACAQLAVAADSRTEVDFVTAPDGIRIAYEAHGSGEPALVFVHGWSCDRSYWKGQLEPFSRRHRVVAVDLGGHGESGLGRNAWTIAAFGGDVAAVVRKLDLQRVILVGHSMGGDVVAEAARQLPGRVTAMVWVDVYKRLGTPRTDEQREALVAPFRADFVNRTQGFVRGMFPSGADPSLVERVAADMSSAPPTVALGAMESALSYDHEMPNTLQALKLPVVAINPDAPPSDIASLERHGVEVVYMSGVGHFLMMEDPARFNEILQKVIDRGTR